MKTIEVTLKFKLEMDADYKGRISHDLESLPCARTFAKGLGRGRMKKLGIRKVHPGSRKLQFLDETLDRAERDRAHGVLPLGEAKCDSCSELAYTRFYSDIRTKREKVAYTVCEKHLRELEAENVANRKRLGLA